MTGERPRLIPLWRILRAFAVPLLLQYAFARLILWLPVQTAPLAVGVLWWLLLPASIVANGVLGHRLLYRGLRTPTSNETFVFVVLLAPMLFAVTVYVMLHAGPIEL